ncbi:MAG: hypothetical protein ACRD8K_05185 [Nitrososphaeraceae archaeon]
MVYPRTGNGSILKDLIRHINNYADLCPLEKITRGLSKSRKYAIDRAPTIDEIQQTLRIFR